MESAEIPYTVANICDALTKAALSGRPVPGLRCVSNAQLMYHVDDPIGQNVGHYIIPVYDDTLFALLRCIYERGADPIYVEAAFRNAFECGVLARLHPQADGVLVWRILNFPPELFESYMGSFAKGMRFVPVVSKPDGHMELVYTPGVNVLVVLIRELCAKRWTAAEFVKGVSLLVRLHTQFPFDQLYRVVPHIGRKDALTLAKLLIPTTECYPNLRTRVGTYFMGFWRLSNKDMQPFGVKPSLGMVYDVLIQRELSSDEMRWVLSQALKVVRMDENAWRLVLSRRDYGLCVWLLRQMYLMPDMTLLQECATSAPAPEVRSFCEKLIPLYTSPPSKRKHRK